jgi:sRNA-binding protein
VVALVQPAEMRQAEYYRAMLGERRARVEDEIADQSAALAERPDVRGMRHLVETIADKRKEQFELDCLLTALERRFFPRRAKPPKPVRCYDIEVTHRGSWWKVNIPEIAAVTKAGRRDDVALVARAHIAALIGIPIAEIGVRVVRGS